VAEAATPAPAAAAVQVLVAPVKIEQRIFDPANPPPGMPRLIPPEAAFCEYGYRCTTECNVESVRVLFKTKPATITGVTVTVGMEVILWLPNNAPPKLTNHELAHQKVCEVVYQHAEATARELAEMLVGHKLQHSLKEEAALREEIKGVQNDLVAAYMGRIGGACARMQQYLDSITKHGIDSLDEEEAIARVLAQETLTAGSSGIRMEK
jgi:hypothetical protein